MKPCHYELNLGATEQDAALLQDYLQANCIPGKQVELWNLWVTPGSGASTWQVRWRTWIWTP